jgi:peptidoglycan DL-endopeptidase CwlO
MRALLLVLCCCLAAGCATGAPVGGRSSVLAAQHRAFTPPAAPRAIPATPAPPAAVARAQPLSHEARTKVVAAARSQLGRKQVVLDGRKWPSDCTGLVRAAFSTLEVDLLGDARAGDNAVTAIRRYVLRHGRVYQSGRPMPGDLVFFKETYDLNRDGRHNDGLTHVGVVEDVDGAGTVTVIHLVSSGVVRYRMNLTHPTLRKDPATGAVLNDVLRSPGPGRREVLTGQLFAGYATLVAQPSEVAGR